MLIYQLENSTFDRSVDIKYYSNANFPLHIHKSLEFIYTINGTCELTINEKECLLKQGDGALVLSNTAHAFSVDENSKIWICVFSEDYVPDFAYFTEKKVADNYSFHCPPEVQGLINSVMSTTQSDRYISNGMINAVMETAQIDHFGFKGLFYIICSNFLSGNKLTENKNTFDNLIYNIIKYVSENFTQQITLSTCAAHVGYNKNYISTCLNNSLKMGFSDFLNMLRIDYAIRLLYSTNHNITTISNMCGFGTLKNFNLNFKKQTGCSPTEYRKMYTNTGLTKPNMLN